MGQTLWRKIKKKPRPKVEKRFLKLEKFFQ